jgi:hypothetical protein
MPRLSLWKPQKANDYRFLDRTISEMFTVGATDLYVHKYLGSNNPSNSTDLTQPHYDQLDPTNIQDLLFLENRDRKYDPNIYRLRGHYNVQNLDFDLSQFGLFLTNDIIFLTVHYNDMIDVIGRKLMVGDVFELPHLTDYHPLNQTIPIGLRRYYQITDANFASEGFSVTWWPHLWRIKCEPLVDSQEFSQILQEPINKDNYLGEWDSTQSYQPGYTVMWGDKIYTPKIPVPPGVPCTDTNYWELSTQDNLRDIIGRYNKNLEINQANIDEAKRLVPETGYDRNPLYVVPTFLDGEPAPPVDVVITRDPAAAPTGTIVLMGGQPVLLTPGISNVIEPSVSVMMSQDYVAPVLTDSGSGPVSSTPVVVLSTVTPPYTIPYGTADNTYSSADQYLEFTLTANSNAIGATTISVVDLTDTMNVDLLVSGKTYSPNGTEIDLFPPDTRIVSFNTVNKTFTVNNASLSSIPAGTFLRINNDFTGEVTINMDYRADSDPRYQFIRRSTPRSFGYIVGYDSGDGTAPNGDTVEAGTSFPANPVEGDYFLRLDYLPQKLFRWNGKIWVEISRKVRTEPGFVQTDRSQLSTFINNDATIQTSTGGTVPSRQGLSNALRIQPD